FARIQLERWGAMAACWRRRASRNCSRPAGPQLVMEEGGGVAAIMAEHRANCVPKWQPASQQSYRHEEKEAPGGCSEPSSTRQVDGRNPCQRPRPGIRGKHDWTIASIEVDAPPGSQ